MENRTKYSSVVLVYQYFKIWIFSINFFSKSVGKHDTNVNICKSFVGSHNIYVIM